MKYGSGNTKITISLSLKDGIIELKVHNYGSAISPEDQPKIFIPYERTETAREGDQRGWGIGLALVKAIVESHSGSIELESDEEKGTTFIVKIPHLIS